MPDQPVPGSRAESAIDTYYTSRVQRAQRANQYAREELMGRYQSQVNQLEYLRGQRDILRQERKAIDEELIEWRKQYNDSLADRTGAGMSSTTLNELWRTLRETAKAQGVESRMSAQRRIQIAEVVLNSDFEPSKDVMSAAATSIQAGEEALRGAMVKARATMEGGQVRPEALRTVADQFYSGTETYAQTMANVAAGMTPEQRSTVANKAVSTAMSYASQAGINVDGDFQEQISKLVGDKFGLAPEEFSGEALDAVKAQRMTQYLDMAGSSQAGLNTVMSMAIKALETHDASQAQVQAVKTAMEPELEKWNAIKADLRDGALDDPELQAAYDRLKANPELVPMEDRIYFDPLLLDRFETRAGVDEDLVDLEAAIAGVNPVAPTREDIRQRAGAIQAGQSTMPATAPTFQDARDRRQLRDQVGTTGLREMLGLPSTPPPVQPTAEDHILSRAIDASHQHMAQGTMPDALHPYATDLFGRIRQGTARQQDLISMAKELTQDPDELQTIVGDTVFLNEASKSMGI